MSADEQRSHIFHCRGYTQRAMRRGAKQNQKRDAYVVPDQYQKEFYAVKNFSSYLPQHQRNYHQVIPRLRGRECGRAALSKFSVSGRCESTIVHQNICPLAWSVRYGASSRNNPVPKG